MSNYTKSTNFLAKDSLSDTDPNKIIKGSEFDTEFNSLQTAVNSKANTASPAFTGTPTAPTAALGTNSTQLATTEFVATGLSTQISSDNTWTGKQTFKDNKFEVVDNSDATKKLNVELSGITTATTRTLTIADKDGTIALTSDLPSVDPLSTDSSSYVSGTYSVTSSASITITATNTFSANQKVYLTFTNTTGTVLTSGVFTIVSATGSNFVITYGSSVTSTGTVIAARYGYSAIATPTEVTTGTDNLKYVTPSSLKNRLLTQGTQQNSTSGSDIPFINIPSWVKRITILINGVSTTGTTGTINVQLGTGSTPTYTTTGYSGSVVSSGGTGSVNSSGFNFVIVTGAGDSYYGKMTISNMSGNVWISDSIISRDTATVHSGVGVISLPAALTALRINSPSATTFDAGTINILYE